MTADQRKTLFSSFIKSQFTYCLVSMFCTKHSIGRIKRCLRLIQQNCTSDFEVLLENSNEKPVHQKLHLNSWWLRLINTWMAYILIAWVTSLNSEKIRTIWEILICLNLRMPEQKSLAKTALHIELVNFGKMFLRKLEIQTHFLCLRRK